MLSIKKHIEGLEVSRDVVAAYQSLLDGILGLTEERLPSKDASERRKFGKRLKSWTRKLRKASKSSDVVSRRDELLEVLEKRWDVVEANAAEREGELLKIFGLLSETASRLDGSNQGFYKNLYQSVHALEAIGKLDDLSRLRRELSEHVKRLEATVGQHEKKTASALQSMQSSLSTAEKQVQVVSRLVSSDPLKALPARRHAEQFLGGLVQRERTFAAGVILIDRIDRIARRYGDDCAEQILARFSASLRESLPAKVHLYRWEEHSFVVFTSHIDKEELQQGLVAFLQRKSSLTFETGDKTGRPATIEPRYVVHQVTPPSDAAKLVSLIEQFCETALE